MNGIDNRYKIININTHDIMKTLEKQKTEAILNIKTSDNSVIKENSDNIKQFQKETQQAESIAIKIIKDENISKEEMKFLKEKYPGIKELANKVKNENNDLKQIIKSCNSYEERINILTPKLKDLQKLITEVILSEIEVKLKTEGLNELEKYINNINKHEKKAESIAIKIIKGEIISKEENEFITIKYPKLKYFISKLMNESNEIKNAIRNCTNEKEMEMVLDKEVKVIEEMENNNASKIIINLKKAVAKEISKFIKNIEVEHKSIERIFIKLLKGEKLNRKEEVIINKKDFAEVKQIIDKTIKEIGTIKNDIKTFDKKEDLHKFIDNEIEELNYKIKKQEITLMEFKIKKYGLERLKEEAKTINQDTNQETLELLSRYPFLFLNLGITRERTSILVIIIAVVAGIILI